MLDSAGRFGPGILRGHIYFAGHFSECKAIDFPVKGRSRNLKGEYFRLECSELFIITHPRIAVDITAHNNTEEGTCSRGGQSYLWLIMNWIYIYFLHYWWLLNIAVDLSGLGFKFGVCLPAGCTTADLMNVFRPGTFSTPLHVQSFVHSSQNSVYRIKIRKHNTGLRLRSPETGDPLFIAPICKVQRTNDNVPPLGAGFYITV